MLFKLEGREDICTAPGMRISKYIYTWLQEHTPWLINQEVSNTFLVTLRCVKHGDDWQSSRIITEMLRYDGKINDWFWDNYWWMTELDNDTIELLGFIDANHIIINGAPDSFKCTAQKYGYVKTNNGEKENELED